MENIKLTFAEVNHIVLLLKDNEREGWHFPPANQYWSRHNRIKKKLYEAIKVEFEEFKPENNGK